MTYNAKIFNYANLTPEDQQMVQAQLCMVDEIDELITEYTYSKETEVNLLEIITYQEGIKAFIEAKQRMYSEIVNSMVFAISGYEHEIEERETNDFFYGLYQTSEDK